MIIQTQAELAAFCQKLAKEPYITVDTEFLRDRTYYPRLCLLQMAGPGTDAAAIDPIDKDIDLAPVFDLMADEKVLKVFHAARQDLEIFHYLNGALPRRIFDTQVAAMVCGYGDQIAYNALVRDLTGHQLEKNAQFTDWSRRPLSDKQLKYALDDVIYLREVYEKLDAQLIKENREHWVFEEVEFLSSASTYELDPQDAWQRIKIKSDKPEVLAILRALAAWREEEARRKDVPRGRILKDETLADISIYMPKDVEGLRRIRSLPGDIARSKTGEKVLEIIATARKTPKKDWPKKERRDPLPKHATAALEMLKLLLKINCAEADVAPKLVATSDDLERLAVEENPDIPALHGWRRDVFGEDALKLKTGTLSLALQGTRIKKITAE